MRGGHHEVARAYVLYRERRAQERAKQAAEAAPREAALHVVDDGRRVPLDMAALQALIEAACAGLGDDVRGRADPRRDAAQPVRRRADRRGAQGGDPGRAHADRERAGVHAGHGAAAAAHHPQGGARRGGGASRDGAALCRVLPAIHQPAASMPSCSIQRCASSIWRGSARRSSPSAICSSTTWACRRCTTATFCTSTSGASSCRRRSSCAWPWAWRCTRSIAKRARSSSTTCCRPSTSCRARRRCSTPARCARSCRAATSPPWPTTSTASTRR